ncbi:hypothetical protein JB92DRAFT_2957467 [Gautieria morchelliformis]|nr:hypothetical protein JB92DRAFT_2957467 [Gautieria morchelliformis]
MRSGTCCPRRVGSAATHVEGIQYRRFQLTFREASSGGAVPPSTVPRPRPACHPKQLSHTPHPGLPPAAPFSTLPSKRESTHCPAAVAWFSRFLSPSPSPSPPPSSSRALGLCGRTSLHQERKKT